MPLLNHERPVTSVLAAPTAKCATKLIIPATIMAAKPCIKKKGIIGINAPMPVETVAEIAATQGLGKFPSDRPSSSCASERHIERQQPANIRRKRTIQLNI